MDDQHVGSRFLVKKAKEFYGFTKAFEPTVERDKYRFFLSTNALMDLKKYHNDTLPKVATVQACNTLVQGTTGAGRGLLERYLREAVATTHAMWREVEAYLEAPQSSYDDPQLTEDKQHFPLLRRHWNLDCGVAPGVDLGSESWSLPNLAETRLHVAGTLTLNSVHRPDWPDLNAANVPLAAPALGTITVQVVTAGANPVGVCHTLVIESTQSGQEWRFDEVSPDLARSQTYGTQHPFPAGQYQLTVTTRCGQDHLLDSDLDGTRRILVEVGGGDIPVTFPVERRVTEGLLQHPDIDVSTYRVTRIEHAALDCRSVKALVLHQTAGATAGGAVSHWRNATANPGAFGAHFIVEKDGAIYQSARVDRIAYHSAKVPGFMRCTISRTFDDGKRRTYECSAGQTAAGISWENSLGIEFVGIFRSEEYGFEDLTALQFQSGRFLVAYLMELFRVPADQVYAHPEIAAKKLSEAYSAKACIPKTL